ncbi:MAG: DedA family protein [Bacillota bacterium]
MELTTWISGFSPLYLYAALFLFLAVEGIGLPGVPFVPLMLVVGHYIERGAMDYWLTVLVGASGNLAGNIFGYWIGATSTGWIGRLWHRPLSPQSDMNKVKSWIQRYGAPVVVFSRWFGPIRTPTILGASTMGIRPWTFIIGSAIGAATWTAAWQFASWRLAEFVINFWSYLNKWEWVFVTVFVVLSVWPFCYIWWRHQRKKSSQGNLM